MSVSLLLLLSIAVRCACIVEAGKQHPGSIETTAKIQRKRIEGATKAHPTSATMADHWRRLMTMKDNCDRAEEERGADSAASVCKTTPRLELDRLLRAG